MSTPRLLRSRRTLAGGVALFAGAAGVAAPVVAPPLAASPLNDADVSPGINGSNGTYESCTEMFGLTNKDNASYVTFAVTGTATPLPALGDGLTAVLTVDDGSSTEECTLEEGFANEAEWFGYFGGDPESPFIADGFPYPGSPGYLVPNFGGFELLAAALPAAPVPILTLRVEVSDPTLTVTSSPTDIDILPPSEGEIPQIIANELGGPTSPLGSRYLDYIGGGGCDSADPDDIALADALIELTGVPQAVYDEVFPDDPCNQLILAIEVRGEQVFFAYLGTSVSVTVNGPTPEPAPTPAPAPGPVTPSFTG